jgi:hypothetical protein
MVLEAGGMLTDHDGLGADPRRGRLVASNGKVHGEALALVREARGGLGLPKR